MAMVQGNRRSVHYAYAHPVDRPYPRLDQRKGHLLVEVPLPTFTMQKAIRRYLVALQHVNKEILLPRVKHGQACQRPPPRLHFRPRHSDPLPTRTLVRDDERECSTLPACLPVQETILIFQ